MITKNIDLDIIDDEGQESAVEIIMGNVERAVLVGTISVTSKDQIEKLVLKIERFMQDLSDDDTETSKFTLKKINESLKVILPILKSDDINHMSLEIIENYLNNLLVAIKSKLEILKQQKYKVIQIHAKSFYSYELEN